jgi:hypothetical protein
MKIRPVDNLAIDTALARESGTRGINASLEAQVLARGQYEHGAQVIDLNCSQSDKVRMR